MTFVWRHCNARMSVNASHFTASSIVCLIACSRQQQKPRQRVALLVLCMCWKTTVIGGWIPTKQARDKESVSMASCQIRKIAGCACAGNAGEFFPHHRGLAIPSCITARAYARTVMHTEIANWWFPLKSVAGKRSRHSRRMRNPQYYVSGKRPIPWRHHGSPDGWI